MFCSFFQHSLLSKYVLTTLRSNVQRKRVLSENDIKVYLCVIQCNDVQKILQYSQHCQMCFCTPFSKNAHLKPKGSNLHQLSTYRWPLRMSNILFQCNALYYSSRRKLSSTGINNTKFICILPSFFSMQYSSILEIGNCFLKVCGVFIRIYSKQKLNISHFFHYYAIFYYRTAVAIHTRLLNHFIL